MIKAVVFDLDDTLYPEMDYVRSGYDAVAKAIEKIYGLKNADKELISLFEQGRLGVFDRYLKKHNLLRSEQTVGELVDIYRYHRPSITLSQDVKQTLINLRKKGYKLGIITDGRPKGQLAKINALGLDELVDKIIITDELGSIECRKPNSVSFRLMCKEFGIAPEEMIYIGDNPEKDFAVKRELPIKTIHYVGENGLYSGNYLNSILPDMRVMAICEIEDAVECMQ